MSRSPETGRGGAGQKFEQALEKALDPLATALKRATTPARTGTTAPAPGKPGLQV